MNGWPAALVLVALIASSTLLAWKGVIPSHAFFMIAGAAATWAVPRAAQLFMPRAKPAPPLASSTFPPEEIPTKREHERNKKMSEAEDPKDEAQAKLAAEGIPLGRYQHYKGPEYEAFALTVDEGTLEQLVHYKSLLHGTSWTRTIKNFTEEVEVDGRKVPRFAFVARPKGKTFWARLFGL